MRSRVRVFVRPFDDNKLIANTICVVVSFVVGDRARTYVRVYLLIIYLLIHEYEEIVNYSYRRMTFSFFDHT